MKRWAFACVTQLSVEPEADTAIKHSEKPGVGLQDLTPVAPRLVLTPRRQKAARSAERTPPRSAAMAAHPSAMRLCSRTCRCRHGQWHADPSSARARCQAGATTMACAAVRGCSARSFSLDKDGAQDARRKLAPRCGYDVSVQRLCMAEHPFGSRPSSAAESPQFSSPRALAKQSFAKPPLWHSASAP